FSTGTNIITASVHSNYRSTPSHSFALEAVATIGTQPLAPEPDPEPEPDPDPDPDPADVDDIVAADADWSYSFPSTPVASDWNLATFDDSAWAMGAGVF